MVDLVRKYPNGRKIAPTAGEIGETIIGFNTNVAATASSASANTYTPILASITLTPGVWLITWTAAFTGGDYGMIGVTDDNALTGMLPLSNKATGIVPTVNTVGSVNSYNNSVGKTLNLFMKNKSGNGTSIPPNDQIASVLTNDGTTHIMAIRIA